MRRSVAATTTITMRAHLGVLRGPFSRAQLAPLRHHGNGLLQIADMGAQAAHTQLVLVLH